MDQQVKIRDHQSVTIVDVEGRLTLGPGTENLRQRIQELISNGNKRIVLNLKDVTYLDSSAVGELVAAYRAVTAARGEMKLVNLSRRLHDLLTITKLHIVFEIFDDEPSAIRSFHPVEATRPSARPEIYVG